MTWREEILWSAPAERLAATALWLPAQPIPYLLRRLLARVAAQTASPRAAQSTRNTWALSVGIKLGFQIPVMLWCASMRASSTSVLRRVGCQKRVYNARNRLPSTQNGHLVSACGLDAVPQNVSLSQRPQALNPQPVTPKEQNPDPSRHSALPASAGCRPDGSLVAGPLRH